MDARTLGAVAATSTAPTQLKTYTLQEAAELATPGFILEGLISDTMTLVHGKPKAGKSALVQALVASILKDEPFLGRQLKRPIQRVLILATDSGALSEYSSRIRDCDVELGYARDSVIICPLPELSEATVTQATEQLRPTVEDLLIVDHLSDFAGDINSIQEVSALWRAIERCRHGAPTVVVAHNSTSVGMNGRTPKKPLGSTAIEAKARWLVHVEAAGDRITISGKGNAAARVELTLSRGSHAAAFELQSEATAEELNQAQRRRAKETQDRRTQAANFVRQHGAGLTKRAIGVLLAAEFPESNAESWRQALAPSKWLGKMLATEV